MIIDVWSDVVCPWCFIGKTRLDKAIAALDPSINVEVRHRAFQLQPDIQGVTPTKKLLAAKYGVDEAKVDAMQANVCSIAGGEGLCYDLAGTLSGNTADAHRLLLWSATVGKQAELQQAMYSAYFEKNQALFTRDDLVAVAGSVGIDASEVNLVLDSNEFVNQVREDQEMAHSLGANGVPFFVIDMKIGISGAQPPEVFNRALQQALSS